MRFFRQEIGLVLHKRGQGGIKSKHSAKEKKVNFGVIFFLPKVHYIFLV